jgi:hypothetical protein
MSRWNPLNWLSAATDAMNASSPGTTPAAPAAPAPAPPAPATSPAPAPAPATAAAAAPTKSSSKQQLYFVPPPIISSYTRYQDVNNDSKLQEMETLYFLERTKECIKYNKSWNKLKKFSKYLKGEEGYEIMHKLLRLFVKRGNTNWYDLKIQQELVLDFIKHKLSKIN